LTKKKRKKGTVGREGTLLFIFILRRRGLKCRIDLSGVACMTKDGGGNDKGSKHSVSSLMFIDEYRV
jgi:hypothetical protein